MAQFCIIFLQASFHKTSTRTGQLTGCVGRTPFHLLPKFTFDITKNSGWTKSSEVAAMSAPAAVESVR